MNVLSFIQASQNHNALLNWTFIVAQADYYVSKAAYEWQYGTIILPSLDEETIKCFMVRIGKGTRAINKSQTMGKHSKQLQGVEPNDSKILGLVVSLT